MINHLRTLLLNTGRDGYPPTFPEEEYVVPKYRPRQLTDAVQRVWSFLFGSAPDRLFLNYRLRQLLTVVHTSELVSFVYRSDARVTYWPFVTTAATDPFGITITRSDPNAQFPYVFGLPACDDGAGQCEQSWRVVALSPTQISVETRRPTAASELMPLAFDMGLSATVPLPRSGLSLRFKDPIAGDYIDGGTASAIPTNLLDGGGAGTATTAIDGGDAGSSPGDTLDGGDAGNSPGPIVDGGDAGNTGTVDGGHDDFVDGGNAGSIYASGTIWVVTSRGRPTVDIGELLEGAAAVLGPAAIDALFVTAGDIGPTLQNVWKTHPTSANRYAAMILGLAAAIEQSPQRAD